MLTTEQPARSKTYTLISLFVLIAIDTMGVGLVWPLFGPLFMDQSSSILPASTSLLVRDLLYGVTMGIFPVCMFFGAPILGDLSDHIGRKKVLLICLYGTCVGLGICTLGIVWRDVYLLILGRALLGVLAGSQATAQASIVDISPAKKKAMSLSIITLAGNLGFIVGPMLGGLMLDKNLVSWFSVTTPFVVSAILAFLNATILLVVFKETFHPQKLHKINFTKGFNVFISAFTNKNIRLLAIAYLGFQLGWAMYFQFCVIYFVQFHGYSGVQVGYFLSVLSLIFALSLLGVMRLLLRYFTVSKILRYNICGAALSFMVAMLNREMVLWISMVPAACCVAISYTGLITLLSDSVSSEEQGWVMGIAGAMSAVAWSVGALLSGSLGAFHLPIPFLMAGLVVLASFGLLCFRDGIFVRKDLRVAKSENKLT